MLQIKVTTAEEFDESTSQFVVAETVVLDLEHSLQSLSKWESRWLIPFLSSKTKTEDQVLDYIRMMVVGPKLTDEVLNKFSIDNFQQIHAYIDAPMSATTFNDKQSKGSKDIVTSEIIYYWMIELGIPFECQEWNLNRLLTLIKVCNIKRAPKKKMNSSEIRQQQQDLNERRRKELGSRG